MSKLDTDLNVSPYFDDYDEDKRFYRILFRPATAVQARELTQLQTAIQSQIQRGGDFMFKDGSIVDGCPINYYPKFEHAYLKDLFNANTLLSLDNVEDGMLLTNSPNSNNAVRAVVRIAKKGFEQQYPYSNRIYYTYIATGDDGANNQVESFSSGEVLYLYNTDQDKLGILDANNLIDTIDIITSNSTANAIGYGYGVSVGEGTVYQKGYYQLVEPQIITVKEFDRNPNNFVVGFNTVEEIVRPEQDESLFDNALGYSNYNAPGAHRLKLIPTLVAKNRADISNNVNFFAIVEFDAKQPTQENSDNENQLGKILDRMAIRTKEESGNYSVKPWTVEPVPHSAANNQLFEYEVSPGIGYVNGYRVEKINTFRIETLKATTTAESQAQIVTTNYGNYVLVDEVVGAFDIDNYDEVALYDTAQNAISDIEGSTASPSGSVIGYANIRGFVYDQGDKGAPDCQYRAYLFNIRMNSAQSFSSVKSLYATSGFGNAKADIVLESNNTAVIKDARRNTLVFPTGYPSIKRFRDKNGVNDTQFIFRDVASATMSTNATVTFTLNTPANGGNERLGVSPGVISDTLEQSFNISLSTAAYTGNLPGTVTVAGTTVTGLGTDFNDKFIAGDMVRINGAVRRVDSIANATSMTISSTVSASANVYQKYYVAGHVVNTSDFGGTITVLSNTQFIVDTNLDANTGSLDATQTVYAQYPVLRTQAVQTAKEIKKNRFVKIDCSNNVANTVGPWDLGVTDLHKIRNIYVGTNYANTNPERSAWFVTDNGQRDSFYDHGRLVLKPQYKDKITSSSRILVELDYFTANTAAGIGFFTVDSYPIDDANTANTTAIQTAEIPLFYSSTLDQTVDMRNAIDFRPYKYNTATDAITEGTATVNPSTSNNSFIVSASGSYVAEPDSNFQADIEYYLPRVDLVVVNEQGKFSVRKGNPAEAPVEPKNESDTSVVARVDVPGYPSLSPREAAAYGRPDLATKTSIKSNKRYTMKDIRALEDRISRMEYYTTLNLLEQKAKDMVIQDDAGLDRFKNGIFADSFYSHLLGKVTDIEYNVAIDKDKGIARPKFVTHDVDFTYDANNSVDVVKKGHVLMMPYTQEAVISQRYASKFRLGAESVWSWKGKVNMFPSYDHFRDETRNPAVNMNLDLTSQWDVFVNSPFGTNFGDWRITNQTVDQQINTSVRARNGTVGAQTRTDTVTTTTTDSERLVSQMSISGTTTDVFDFGTYVSDVAISPWMRSRNVAFIASGLKPNTVIHAHFDGKLVDEHCAPGVLSGITDVESGREERIVNRNAEFGTTLRTDSAGTLIGIFRIPAETFRVGDRPFILTNVDDLVAGADAQVTFASFSFTASNVSVTKDQKTLTTVQPQLAFNSGTETRQNVDVDIDTELETEVVETIREIITIRETETIIREVDRVDEGGGNGGDAGGDPLSQTFKVVTPGNTTGMFVSKVGVFFKQKDPTLGCECWIVETSGGIPNTSKCLTKKHLTAAEISVSDDASAETVFEFDIPVYVKNLTEYAFMIKPDGNSPEYLIWVAETGGFDIASGTQIYSNPYSGMMFVSANMSTWTAKQTEDVKFNLYRARFTPGWGYAIFNNEDDEYLTVDGFTKANTNYTIEVGDVVVRYDTTSNTIVSNPADFDYAYATVQKSDDADSKLVLDGSNGGFQTNTVIQIHRPTTNAAAGALSNTTLIATSTIESIDNVPYHSIVPRFLTMEPALTRVIYDFKGSDESYGLDGSYRNVINDYDTEYLDETRIIASRSNEVDFNSSEKTAEFKVKMETKSTYVSPVIDMRRKSFLMIENKINNDSTNEQFKYGNALSKYISKNVTLDDNIGNAEDMKVMVGAYRPVDTDIEVYVKLIGSDDQDPFDSKMWTKMNMTATSAQVFSSPINPEDMREYEFDMPTSILHTDGSATTAYLNNGIVQYARADGALVVGFKTFCFKVVFKSSNPVKVPRLNDIRAIALQK